MACANAGAARAILPIKERRADRFARLWPILLVAGDNVPVLYPKLEWKYFDEEKYSIQKRPPSSLHTVGLKLASCYDEMVLGLSGDV